MYINAVGQSAIFTISCGSKPGGFLSPFVSHYLSYGFSVKMSSVPVSSLGYPTCCCRPSVPDTEA